VATYAQTVMPLQLHEFFRNPSYTDFKGVKSVVDDFIGWAITDLATNVDGCPDHCLSVILVWPLLDV
jgi:hypothetical protein